LESAVIVERHQTIVDQGGKPFVLGGGDGTDFPVAGIERDTGHVQFHTKRSTVFRAVRAAGGSRQDKYEQDEASYRK